jgi:predicted ester cyclase
MGIKATKKPVGDRRIAIAWFNDDGTVSRWHEYADVPGMVAQMKGAKDAPAIPAFPDDDDADDHAASDTREEDKLAGWFTSVNDAFNQDDAKAIGALDAPDAEATLYFFGGKSVSGKGLSAFHVDFVKAFPRAQFAVQSAWGIDGFVVVERTMTATHKGPFGDMPASNREVTTHFAEVIQPGDDGKIERTWSYGNLAELTAAAKKTK